MDGDLKRSQGYLDAALGASPDFPPAILFRGRLRYATEGVDAALADAEKVLAKDDKNLAAWRFKSDLLMFSKRDTAAALTAYARLVALDPASVGNRAAQITATLMSGDLKAGEALIEALRAVAPRHLQTAFFDAQLAFERGNLKRARELTQILVQYAPNLPALQMLVAAIEFQSGAYDQAELVLKKAMLALPDALPMRKLLSRTYLRTGKGDKALETLQPLLEGAAPEAEALGIAAEAHLLAGRFDRAEQLFAKALEKKPDDAAVGTALAQARLRKGDAERGLADLQAISAKSDDAQADFALVSAYIGKKAYADALKQIEVLDKKLPKSPQPLLLQARVHGLMRNADAERASLTAAVQRAPDNEPAVVSLALLDLRQGKRDAAIQRLEQAVAQNGKSELAWISLAGIHAPVDRQQAVKVLERAVAAAPGNPEMRVLLMGQLLSLQRMESALSVADAAVIAFPSRPDVLDMAGRAQLAAGRPNAALKTYATAALLQPTLPGPVLRQAEVMHITGDREGALKAAQRALGLAPDSVAAVTSVITLLNQMGQQEQALQIVKTLRQRYPGEAFTYAFEGDIRMSKRQIDEALAAFRAGLGKANASELAVRLHAALLRAERRADAAAFAAEWQQKQPKDVGFLKHLGDLATAAGDHALAERIYARAARLAPMDPAVLNDLAWALVQQKKPEALALAIRAQALAPDVPAILDTKIQALLQAGKTKEALADWEYLVATAPNAPRYRLQLAKTLIDLGDKAKARQHLELLQSVKSGVSQDDVRLLLGKL